MLWITEKLSEAGRFWLNSQNVTLRLCPPRLAYLICCKNSNYAPCLVTGTRTFLTLGTCVGIKSHFEVRALTLSHYRFGVVLWRRYFDLHFANPAIKARSLYSFNRHSWSEEHVSHWQKIYLQLRSLTSFLCVHLFKFLLVLTWQLLY